MEKICTRCKEPQPLNAFAFDKRAKDGYNSWCRECKSIRRKTPEQIENMRQTSKAYYATPEGRNKILDYAKNNREAANLNSKKYRQTEKGRLVKKASNQKRREVKAGLFENYTKHDRVYTTKLFNNKCFNCSSTSNLQIDHHRPLSKGYSLVRENAVLLCENCNYKKHNKDPEEFYSIEQLTLLEERYNIKDTNGKYRKVELDDGLV